MTTAIEVFVLMRKLLKGVLLLTCYVLE